MAISKTNLTRRGIELADFPITPGQEFPASINGEAFAARWMWCDTGGAITYTNVAGQVRTRTVSAGLIPFAALAVASFGGTGLSGFV